MISHQRFGKRLPENAFQSIIKKPGFVKRFDEEFVCHKLGMPEKCAILVAR